MNQAVERQHVEGLVLECIRPQMEKCFIEGKVFIKMKPAEKRELTKHVQMIFQDPYSSLDPRKKST